VYICGTDEYGTATETKARSEGLTPRAICDQYHAKHKCVRPQAPPRPAQHTHFFILRRAIYEWFDISFDFFGRTSTADPAADTEWQHTKIAQEIFHDNAANDNFEQKNTEQVYCCDCATFLADRLVSGTCPKCGDEEAKGDQCDKCGELLSPTQLLNPWCSANREHKLEVRSTDHLFLRLDKLQPQLEALTAAAADEKRWSSNGVQITRSWLKQGLLPRAITRDLKWGTPVPEHNGLKNKVFYVWYDAPIGYISMTANYTPEWRKWWHATKDDVSLVQFMGKDNVPFHTIIFPACLQGTGKPWTPLDKLSVTEYLTYESGKFSKSRNTGVFGDGAMATGIPSEVWRYYLLAMRPEGSDSHFSWTDFGEKNNNELLANIGNFINRALSFTYATFDGKTPTAEQEGPSEPSAERDVQLATRLATLLETYNSHMDQRNLRDALFTARSISAEGNTYLQDTEPWKVKGSDPARCATICAKAVSLARLVATVLEPFMPAFTDKVCTLLGLPHMDIPDTFECCVPKGHAFPCKPVPIFRRLESDELEGFRAQFGGGSAESAGAAAAAAGGADGAAKGKKKGGKGAQKGGQKGGKGGKKGGAAAADDRDSIARVEFKVGEITKVWNHPEADRLYCEEIDCGEGAPRQIASGLREHYTLEQMQGRRILVVTNLKPRPMKGFVSHGMVLCAKTEDGKVEFADPPAGAKVGERILVGDLTVGEPDEQVNPAKKNNPWVDIVSHLKTNGDKVACYKDIPLTTSAGPVTAPTLANAALS